MGGTGGRMSRLSQAAGLRLAVHSLCRVIRPQDEKGRLDDSARVASSARCVSPLFRPFPYTLHRSDSPTSTLRRTILVYHDPAMLQTRQNRCRISSSLRLPACFAVKTSVLVARGGVTRFPLPRRIRSPTYSDPPLLSSSFLGRKYATTCASSLYKQGLDDWIMLSRDSPVDTSALHRAPTSLVLPGSTLGPSHLEAQVRPAPLELTLPR